MGGNFKRGGRRGGGGGGRQEPPVHEGEYQPAATQAGPGPGPAPQVPMVPYSAIRAEMNDMVAIAMQYPRTPESLERELEEAITEMRSAPELAEKAWYEIEFLKHTHDQGCTGKADDKCPVGSTAEGLSVKAAYHLQGHFRHLASKSYIASETSDRVTIVGVARDLQRNTLVERDYPVAKVIHYRSGGSKTLGEAEMVKVIGAGTSKAIRNAILNTMPDPWKRRYWDACRKIDDEHQTAKAGGKEKAKALTLGNFKALGVAKEMIEEKIGRPVAEFTDEDRIKMRGWYNAINSGETTVEEVFGVPIRAASEPPPGGPTPTAEQFTKGASSVKSHEQGQAPEKPKPPDKDSLF